MTDSLPILPDDLPFFTGISPDKRTAMLTCLGARVRTVRKGESAWVRGSGPSAKANFWSWLRMKCATSASSSAEKST